MGNRRDRINRNKEITALCNNSTICIEIASYCDPELLNTMYSAVIQARYPDRIHFAICYQEDDMSDYNKLKSFKHCKVTHLTKKQSKGSCYARYLCQQLLEDEDYVLHVDSHMRFIKDWDVLIIKQFEHLNDPKAVISVYPPDCNNDAMMKCKLDDPRFDKPACGRFMHVVNFRDGDSRFIRFNCVALNKNSKNDSDIKKIEAYANKPNMFIAAGYFFAKSDVDRVVKFDPEMYYAGDELPIAVRLFTHGYTCYNPDETFIYHQYCRENRVMPSEKISGTEDKRLLKLLKVKDNPEIDLGEYGLGTERTIEEYFRLSGIDFVNKKVTRNAEIGIFDGKHESYKKMSVCAKEHMINNNNHKTIDIVVVHKKASDINLFIEKVMESSDHTDRLTFVIGSEGNELPKIDKKYKPYIRKHILLESPISYGKSFGKLVEFVQADYSYLIYADCRFVKGWDSEYISKLKNRQNTVLTSWCYKIKDDTDRIVAYGNKCLEANSISYNGSFVTEYKAANVGYASMRDVNFITDGIMFGASKIFKDVKLDPSLPYSQIMDTYFARLWTYGYDLGAISNSYIVCITNLATYFNEEPACNFVTHNGILRHYDGYGVGFLTDYKYDIGDKRSIYDWVNKSGLTYDATYLRIKNKENVDK